jgi:hypothetical protein
LEREGKPALTDASSARANEHAAGRMTGALTLG